MNSEEERVDAERLNREVQEIWDQNASFWDEAMGEGNAFQRFLIGPAAEKLLALKPGELVLDVACGNGVFSRRMAQLGAQVVACDFSSVFIERARARSSEYAARIEYEVIDATDYAQLLGLAKSPRGIRRFDAVYCGMAIQDMTEVEPLFRGVASLLKPEGRFVFSVPHPAFNSSYIRRVAEEEDREGKLVVEYTLKVTGYIQPRTDKGLGIIGQPAAQFYFHRPLSLLYDLAFQQGFRLDGISEPVFPADMAGERPFSWANYAGIPPVLVSRMRLS